MFHNLSLRSAIMPTDIRPKMQLPHVHTLSLFESLLETSLLPDARYNQLLHEELHPLHVLFPQKRLLSFLPRSSLLALRLVSITTKIWVECGPRSMFSTLYLSFPFKSKEYAANPRVPSHQASRMCKKLIVNVAASETPLKTLYNIFWGAETLPMYSSLTHLHVNAPVTGSFWPLLEFRMFIQAVESPRLRRFTVNGLSIEGVKALRWGPLTSYVDADWTSSVLWRQITNLDISLVPSMGVADLGRSDEGIQAIKILHDWIGSFGENRFEKVRFEWMENQQGPNPFLLDDIAETYGSGGEPEMPLISWKSCQEIWLGGVSLGTKDLKKITDRVKELRSLMVWRSLLGRETKEGEQKLYSRGQKWVRIRLDSVEDIARECCEETELQESRVETLEDGVTSEERGGGETFFGDDVDALSDGSREVPIFMDYM